MGRLGHGWGIGDESVGGRKVGWAGGSEVQTEPWYG